MRTTSVQAPGRGAGIHDHLCWAFEERAQFLRDGVEFLAEGAELHLRLAYVAPGSAEALVDDLADLPDRDALLASDGLRLIPLGEMYAVDTPVDPAAQRAAYAAATEDARRDGYAGLRVLADATALVRTEAQLDAFARYEHLITQFVETAPFSAVCGYDRGALASERIVEIACMHSVVGEATTPYQCLPADEESIALRGEIDFATTDAFRRTLERVDFPDGEPIEVDCSGLTFIDHRGLLALARCAEARGTVARVHSAPPIVRRLLDLVEIPRVVVAADAA